MEAGTTCVSSLPSQKFSRYRSVRKAAREEGKAPPIPQLPLIEDKQEGQALISRAPSRYHRRPTGSQTQTQAGTCPTGNTPAFALTSQARTTTSAQVVANAEPVAESQSFAPRRILGTEGARYVPRDVEQPHGGSVRIAPRRTACVGSKTSSFPNQGPPVARRSYEIAREEARMILEGEYDRLQILKHQQEQAECERKKRVEMKLSAQRSEQETAVKMPTKGESPNIDRFQQGNLQRIRKWTIDGAGSHASDSVTTPHSPSSFNTAQVSTSSTSSPDGRTQWSPSQNPPLTPQSSGSAGVEPQRRHQRAIVSIPEDTSQTRAWKSKAGDGPPKNAVNCPPQAVDAPVSAVNAGERRVEVRFNKSRITLPVTISTTVSSLLNSASEILSEPMDPRTCVLVETYYPLGLERPLRRYEHIRDIMNSWDSDTQNYLMIMPESECATVGLEQKDAPQQAQAKVMLNLHHSREPGRWEKHWMVLREDGQVTASTKENDGNAVNVFHLSDFDVYMPTKKQMKKLRPPKKVCFAVKSQQRSIMFETTENFVHFFSTNNKVVADQWYHAVQAWRSWYLVTILEAGTTRKEPPVSVSPPTAITNKSIKISAKPSMSHFRDPTSYQPGRVQPLLEPSPNILNYGVPGAPYQRSAEPKCFSSPQRSRTSIDHGRSRSNADVKITGPERHKSTKRHSPPTSFGQRGLVEEIKSKHEDTQAKVGLPNTETGFMGQSLLARAFSVKKTQAEEKIAYLDDTDNAFTGTGLLSGKISTMKLVNEDCIAENSNDAFTGGGLMAVQRSITKKRSHNPAKPGQPLVHVVVSSDFVDGSLLRNVEGYEIATGANLPHIDRSRGREVMERTGEVY